MEKIIAEIAVPALGNTFDFELPAQNSGRETAEDVAAVLMRIHPDLRVENPELYDMLNGRCLNGYPSLAAAGVHDGSRLMLV